MQYLIQILIINQERIGGVFQIYNQKKVLLLFDSHGLDGFKYFIVDNDEKIIDELLYNFKNCKTENANGNLKLCTMTFDLNQMG